MNTTVGGDAQFELTTVDPDRCNARSLEGRVRIYSLTTAADETNIRRSKIPGAADEPTD